MRKLFLAALCITAALPSFAQTRRLTLDDIYDRQKRINFSGAPQRGFVWLDDTHFFYPQTKGTDVVAELVVDAVSGKSVALFDPEALQKEITAIQGVTEKEAKSISHPRSLNLSGNHERVLLTIQDDLYSYDLKSEKLTRLTSAEGEEEEANFSPDGSKVAFVRNNDIYVLDLASSHETRLTSDGNENVLNGKLDWVYQEEIYGRGIFKAYWWSPDSKSIAFLRLDEKNVPRFTIVDHLPVHQSLELQAYPKAGDPNPEVSLHVADVASAAVKKISGDTKEQLIVDVTWQPDSKRVVYQQQDREQTMLDLIATDRTSGAASRILRETTKAWVEPQGSPQWLRDGSFLWLSERNGFKHLYRVDAKGKQTQLTRGDWEVRTLHGVDEKNGFIYFSGTERSPVGLDVYRVKLDGSKLQRLVAVDGTHNATFNPGNSLFLDSWSDINTPPQTRLYRATGELVRVVDENRVPELAQFQLAKPEFMQVKARDGFVMEAVLYRPLNFDPSKKYPVFQQTYSGPHAQSVTNRWQSTSGMWQQFLAQNGIAVWIIDNRTASGKGAVSAWPLYKEFGPSELRDLVDGVNFLKSQPWVDGSRILLNGWSYGGFMTTYALTHSDAWKAGIAGGSVTDWHDYDSVYTERYMLTPEHNKEGYERSAPRNAAKDLHGDLLLLHGAIDDNVHVQNTMQLAYELEKAGKLFQMVLYPKSRHGVTDPDLSKQLQMKMWQFVQQELLDNAK